MSRPMDFFDEILPQLGVKVESNGGKLPLKVRGPLVPGNITVDGNLSSQYTTGLLMAYAAAGQKAYPFMSEINQQAIHRPYLRGDAVFWHGST